jgi:hypothetical protein
MSSLDLSIEFDASEVVRLGHRLQARLDAACVTAVHAAVTEGAEHAVATRRYKDRTGNLSRKTTGELTSAGVGKAEGEIRFDAKYASFVDGGTRPHLIRPKMGAGAVLSWLDADGQRRFARYVHHPGTRPYGNAGAAYLKAEAVLERECDIAIDKACRDLGP